MKLTYWKENESKVVPNIRHFSNFSDNTGYSVWQNTFIFSNRIVKPKINLRFNKNAEVWQENNFLISVYRTKNKFIY